MGYAKIIISVFFCIISLEMLMGLNLSLKPAKIELRGNIGELLCSEFEVSSDLKDIFIEDKWSKIKSEELWDYKLPPSKLGIETSISQSNFNKVCFIANKPGEYFGVLLLRPSGSNFGMGSWIILNISDREKEFKITGAVVNTKNKSLIGIEIAVLLFLVFYLYKIKKLKKSIKPV